MISSDLFRFTARTVTHYKESSMKKRFTDEQIISILREAETGAMPIKALCKKR